MILPKIRLAISRMGGERTRDKLKWKYNVVEGLWKTNHEKRILFLFNLVTTKRNLGEQILISK